MTDLYFPDRSQFQGKTQASAHAILARATEGNWLTDSCYEFNKQLAAGQNALFGAYHFLEDGETAAAQAAYCFSVVGPDVSLMVDIEPIVGQSAALAGNMQGGDGHYCGEAWRTLEALHAVPTSAGLWRPTAETIAVIGGNASYISKPSLALACAFIDAYRSLGGIIHVAYLPRWYWQVLGSPSLQPLIDRRMILHSSDYTTYSDTGPGWQSYGGMTPMCWQYTDSGPGNQDWNAYRSAAATVDGAVAELKSLWDTGSLLSGYREWDTKGKRSLGEVADACGMTPSNVLADTVKHYGGFDPVIAAYLDDVFSRITTKIPAGGKLRVRA